ncbi:MAG TPA: DNA replication protein DnaC, partial [Candidatus Dorea intestinavium]|nr:DNA replication protein DnaC [Candidatus Dorea intestinavium]
MPLPNSLYDEVMRSYEEERLKHHDALQKRYLEINSKVPQIKQLDERISSLSVLQAKKIIEGDKVSLSELKEKLHLLFMEKKKALVAAGYPSDYLEETFTCNDCQDTGYINNRKCHCFKQKEIALLYSQSNLGHILENETFAKFDLSYYS